MLSGKRYEAVFGTFLEDMLCSKGSFAGRDISLSLLLQLLFHMVCLSSRAPWAFEDILSSWGTL